MLSSVNGYSISGSTRLAEQTSNDISAAKSNSNLASSATSNGNTPSINGNENYNVVFNIYGGDPEAVADEVNKKLQIFVERRNKQWA